MFEKTPDSVETEQNLELIKAETVADNDASLNEDAENVSKENNADNKIQ